MSKFRLLKKQLKEAKREIRNNINVDLNKELVKSLIQEIKVRENLKAKGYSTTLFSKITKKFKKYNPDIKLLDNVNYAGKNITRIRFDSKTPYAIDEIQTVSNKLSKYLQEKEVDGRLMTTMNYGKLGWRSGYFDDIGDDVKLYNPADSGIEMGIPKITTFIVYAYFKQKPVGGNDKNNDCLYNCLSEMIVRISDYWETPESLKKYLGLQRNDKIPLKLIPKIESKLRTFQINVRGDYIYTSTVKSTKVINLLLTNEHYEIDKTFKKPPLCKHINYREKIPLLYDKVTFEVYDGTTKRIISKDEKFDLMYNFKSPYILINRQEQNLEMTIEEEFETLVKINNNLKTASNGLINLYKSGSYTNAALDLFDRFTKFLTEPDEILQDEAIWISESNIGALIFSDSYEGELYKYDVKSLYPYLMQQSTLKFPIKRGQFMKLDNFGEFFQYGIYRCKVSLSDDRNINKLFRFNKTNYYTSIALEHAKKLNLKIDR